MLIKIGLLGLVTLNGACANADHAAPTQQEARALVPTQATRLALPAQGRVHLVVLPGSRVKFEGAEASLHDFREQLRSSEKPLKDRQVSLACDAGATYEDLVLVVDVLLQGDCTDVELGGCTNVTSES